MSLSVSPGFPVAVAAVGLSDSWTWSIGSERSWLVAQITEVYDAYVVCQFHVAPTNENDVSFSGINLRALALLLAHRL